MTFTTTIDLKTKALALVALTSATLVLAGCGGSTPTTTPAQAPASSAAASSEPSEAASSAAPSSSAPTEAPSSAAAGVKDPCDVISVADMSDLTGIKLKSQKSSQPGGKVTLCTYTPSGSGVIPVLSAEGDITGSTLSREIKGLQSSAGGDTKVKDTQVEGADEAKAVTANISGYTQVYVVASKGNVFYGGIVGGKEDASVYEDAGVKIVETLIKG